MSSVAASALSHFVATHQILAFEKVFEVDFDRSSEDAAPLLAEAFAAARTWLVESLLHDNLALYGIRAYILGRRLHVARSTIIYTTYVCVMYAFILNHCVVLLHHCRNPRFELFMPEALQKRILRVPVATMIDKDPYAPVRGLDVWEDDAVEGFHAIRAEHAPPNFNLHTAATASQALNDDERVNYLHSDMHDTMIDKQRAMCANTYLYVMLLSWGRVDFVM